MMKRLLTGDVEWISAAGLVLLLTLFAVTVAGAIQAPVDEVGLRLEPLAAADGQHSRLSGDGRALMIPGGRMRDDVAARLHFTLPVTGSGEARWVVWIGRDVVDRVALEGQGWRSESHDFFAPSPEAGLLPAGYQFPLPTDWTGEISLDLRARGSLRGALRVRLLRETAAMRLEQRGAVLGAMVYTALFTLTMLMLALYAAARERIYLLFFGTTMVTLLLMAADNGHLYQVPFLGLLSAWRGQGLWALNLLFLASMLQLLLRYSAVGATRPRFARFVDGYCLLMCLLAAVCLLGLSGLDAWIPVMGTVVWTVGASIAGALIAYAKHRRERAASAIALLLMLIAAAILLMGWIFPGRWMDTVWLRHAYQLAFVGAAAVLSMGLISRIGEFRNQRDQDRLARMDSEKRMHREAARADLNTALQTRLRTLGGGDLEWAAFRILLEHLVPQVPVERAMAMAYGFQGQDILVVSPQSRQSEAEAFVAQHRLQLKRHAANGITLQQPVTAAAEAGVVSTEALVPMPIRAPAWGLLLLQRSGEEGFTTEELALASELYRLTLLHIDQALAAINLRRSAEMDALTGTFNRRTIDQWMARCFIDADRDGHPISVLFVDMDHFKRINDQYGHACGDECLRRVAATLLGSLSQRDLLGRYGGEEFIVVLPGRNGAEAREVGEQLRLAIEGLRIEWEGKTLRLTVSVGMATRAAGEDKPASMVDRADKALYAAKRSGRNCVQVAPAKFG